MFYGVGTVMLVSQTVAPFVGRGESLQVLLTGFAVFAAPQAVTLGQMLRGLGRGGGG